ncbi:hypothetical protein FS842_007896 [Serendipita sp. 407]|nr:hypothetical protein FS842_007896 [Serendipita sp. 407]
MSDARFYFAYGSNLSLLQMKQRCPDSQRVAIAVSPNYRWGISCRGYANIYKSDGHMVYGVLYTLSAKDEKTLDRREGVAIGCYEKAELDVTIVSFYGQKHESLEEGLTKDVLVYIDPRMEEGTPRLEYVGRMEAGLQDAKLPEEWVKESILPLLVSEED